MFSLAAADSSASSLHARWHHTYLKVLRTTSFTYSNPPLAGTSNPSRRYSDAHLSGTPTPFLGTLTSLCQVLPSSRYSNSPLLGTPTPLFQVLQPPSSRYYTYFKVLYTSLMVNHTNPNPNPNPNHQPHGSTHQHQGQSTATLWFSAPLSWYTHIVS